MSQTPKSKAIHAKLSSVEKGTRKLNKFFAGMKKSDLTIRQEKAKAHSIATDTGFYSKAETAQRAKELAEHKERVRQHRLSQEKL